MNLKWEHDWKKVLEAVWEALEIAEKLVAEQKLPPQEVATLNAKGFQLCCWMRGRDGKREKENLQFFGRMFYEGMVGFGSKVEHPESLRRIEASRAVQWMKGVIAKKGSSQEAV